MINKDKKIVIVGAGLAGLTAAAYLSREGYSVLLIEKNETCGGLVNSFNYEGFVFDVGARSLENSGVIKPMLKDLGIQIDLPKSPISLGIESDIFTLNNVEDIKKYKLLLIKKFPKNEKEIEKIFKVINKVTKSMEVIYGFDNPVFVKDFAQNKEYLLKEMLPWFGKFLLAVRHMNKMNEPVNLFLEKYTSNRSLIDMITQHFFKQTPTFFALGYLYVYQEYFYPKGGTGEISKKLTEKVIETGGKVKTNTFITSVDPKNKTITDNSGEKYNYSTLLWAADLKEFYTITDLSNLEDKVKEESEKQKQKVLDSRGGDSIFSLYLGLDLPLDYFSKVSKGHLFYTPSKKGLGETHYTELRTLIDNFDKTSKEEIFSWVDKYCKLNTFEVSVPALRDRSLAPEGKTGLIASMLLEYDLVKKIKDAGWYDVFKKEVENKIIEVLQSSLYPDLKDNIIFQFSFSPLSYKEKVATSEGGITGWTYEKESPVVSDLKKIPNSVKTTIDDIYQIGQWAYTPAGIPTAILTGWYASDDIIKRDKKKSK